MKSKIKEKKFRKFHKYKIKKPFYKKKVFTFTFTFTLISISLFYFFIFFDYFQIKNIDISGNKEIKSSDLIDFIDKKSSNSVFFIDSKSIFLFFPMKILPDILNEFPKISDSYLKRIYPDTIKLEIKERKMIGTFCSQENNCFHFDSTGKIFEKAEEKKGLIVKSKTSEYNLGENVFSKKEIESIVKIWKEIRNEVSIIEFEIMDYEIRVNSKYNYYIRFNTEDDIKFQIIKLNLVLKEKIPQENRKNLEYIDLRFEKMINYKYKNNDLINVVDKD